MRTEGYHKETVYASNVSKGLVRGLDRGMIIFSEAFSQHSGRKRNSGL
jgi:hypothetical protein